MPPVSGVFDRPCRARRVPAIQSPASLTAGRLQRRCGEAPAPSWCSCSSGSTVSGHTSKCHFFLCLLSRYAGRRCMSFRSHCLTWRGGRTKRGIQISRRRPPAIALAIPFVWSHRQARIRCHPGLLIRATLLADVSECSSSYRSVL